MFLSVTLRGASVQPGSDHSKSVCRIVFNPASLPNPHLRQLRQRGVELVIESEGDCTVNAYSMETRQVLLNLARNACEATTAKSARVRIALQGRPEDVLVVVENEGIGIDAAVLERLFQFGVSTKGDRGNGIGLWTVKQLVNHHGGTVAVDSTLGKGSRFTVCWPRKIRAERARPHGVIAMAGAH